MFEVINTPLPGCIELKSKKKTDHRGSFVKTYHRDFFKELGLEVDFSEQYYSVSVRNCLRGLHFQIPPFDHNKLVYCLHGKVLDVVLDIRLGSPTFGKAMSVFLDDDQCNQIYIPPGMAHGFLTLSESAILVYNVSSVYSSLHDMGLHWSSADVDWGIASPIISERDKNLEKFANFNTPFIYCES